MSLLSILIENPIHVLTGVIIGSLSILIYYLFSFYSSRKNYPPGPFPLPFIGNVLLFKQKKHVFEIFRDIGKDYKGMFTFFLGNEPQVIVTDPTLGLEVLKRHQFAGRPSNLMEMFFPKDSVDVVFSDFTKEWEVLRKVIHSAVRKYAVSEKLTYVVADVVDEAVNEMKEKQEKPIDMKHYLFLTMYTIIGRSAFGKDYSIHDKDMNKYIEWSQIFLKENITMILFVYIPFLKYIMRGTWKRFDEIVKAQWEFHDKDYEEHVKTFDGKTIRDFTDALLMARMEAEQEEGSAVLEYLKPVNIQNCVNDLFGAGSETSRLTLTWAFLLMSNYPEKQKRMREEVFEFIGDNEVPNLSHRTNCNYIAAFIAETLRFRYIIPTGVPHKSLVDFELGGQKIKKDTVMIFVQSIPMLDNETWTDPEVFKPERFLDEKGRFVSKPNAFYIPFSAGRWTCPGEKLALADLFYVIARFIQQTKGFEFVLPGGPGSVDFYGDINEVTAWAPLEYQVILKPLKDNDY